MDIELLKQIIGLLAGLIGLASSWMAMQKKREKNIKNDKKNSLFDERIYLVLRNTALGYFAGFIIGVFLASQDNFNQEAKHMMVTITLFAGVIGCISGLVTEIKNNSNNTGSQYDSRRNNNKIDKNENY